MKFPRLLVYTLPALCSFSAAAAPHLTAVQDPFSTVVIPKELQVVQGYSPPSTLAEPELDFEGLRSLLESRRVRTLPELLAALPNQLREDNYLVLYRSRSLQAASPEAPRILSFSPTGKLVLTFNGGDPGVRGGETLEVMQFRDGADRFEFREIAFDGTSAPRISDANPAKCVACHQSASRSGVDMRPNWEPYDVWPGAIGSVDGLLKPLLKGDLKARLEASGDPRLLEDISKESQVLDSFFRRGSTHPRYQHLGAFTPAKTFVFTELMAGLNMRRLVRLMNSEAAVRGLVPQMWSWLGLCEPGWIDSTEAPSLQTLLPVRSIYRLPDAGDDYVNLLVFTTRFFESFGVDTSDWSMDLATGGRLAATNRFSTTTNSDGIFARLLKASLPTDAAPSPASCDSRKSAALSELTALLGNPTVRNRMKAPAGDFDPADPLHTTLQKCLRCHDGSFGLAPTIPFGSEQELRRALRGRVKSGTTLAQEILLRTGALASFDEQMPPTRKLNPLERKSLVDYLNQLKGTL